MKRAENQLLTVNSWLSALVLFSLSILVILLIFNLFYLTDSQLTEFLLILRDIIQLLQRNLTRLFYEFFLQFIYCYFKRRIEIAERISVPGKR